MRMKHVTRGIAAALLFSATSAYAAGPTVLSMPSGIDSATTDTAYAWVGKTINVWGRVEWGDTTGGTYELDCGNGAPVASGAVANADDINTLCTYATANSYFATLTVTDGNSEVGSHTTRIDVVPLMDINAETNLAIERGLKRLYDVYLGLGKSGAIYESTSHSAQGSNTAASVLAFENRGHLPSGDANEEIYVDLVRSALDYVTGDLSTINVPLQEAGNPDSNGNSIGLRENGVGTPQYTAGMMIMALVGSGDSARVAPGGAVAGRSYKDIVQDLGDYCAYAQAEISRGIYRGGWRYGVANYSSSDNSFSQWCPMGMDEATLATGWGNVWSAFVQIENRFWTDYIQDGAGLSGYSNPGQNIWDGQITPTAANVAQMSFQGRPANDADIVMAVSGLNSRWAFKIYNGFYGMYAVTKAMRMARDPANPAVRKTIDMIGAHDWYAEFSRIIIDRQRADGGWTDFDIGSGVPWVNGHAFSTAWAIEILTPALTGQPPVAIAGGPYTTQSGVVVPVSGCSSRHEDSAKFLTLYEWDMDNDGTYEISNAAPTCDAIAPAFADTGADYSATIVLRVTDNVGDTDTSSAQVNITSGNIAPFANAGGPYIANVGADITFDGSASYDPNAGGACGTITKYEWDLQGDGIFEVDAGASPTYELVGGFAAAFSGQIGLRVTDDCGLTGVSQTNAEIAVTNVQLEPGAPYTVVSVQRVGRVNFRYTLQMHMKNTGNLAALGTVAELINSPANVTVESGPLNFGDIAPGATVTSPDSLVLLVNRSISTQAVDLNWRLIYNNGAAVDIQLPWLP